MIALFVLTVAASFLTLALAYLAAVVYMRRLSVAAKARARHRAATAAHGIPLAEVLAAFEGGASTARLPALEEA